MSLSGIAVTVYHVLEKSIMKLNHRYYLSTFGSRLTTCSSPPKEAFLTSSCSHAMPEHFCLLKRYLFQNALNVVINTTLLFVILSLC